MNWNDSYELIMRGQDLEPYGCDTEGCGHLSRGTFGMMIHRIFGAHGLADQDSSARDQHS
jgi:hypothetical protein